jgi:hypothetical protein
VRGKHVRTHTNYTLISWSSYQFLVVTLLLAMGYSLSNSFSSFAAALLDIHIPCFIPLLLFHLFVFSIWILTQYVVSLCSALYHSPCLSPFAVVLYHTPSCGQTIQKHKCIHLYYLCLETRRQGAI